MVLAFKAPSPPCKEVCWQGILPELDADFSLPAAIELQMVEEGSNAYVSGSRFDWTVNDPWRELCKFPKELN